MCLLGTYFLKTWKHYSLPHITLQASWTMTILSDPIRQAGISLDHTWMGGLAHWHTHVIPQYVGEGRRIRNSMSSPDIQ